MNAVKKSLGDEETIARQGPFLRGSEDWINREYARVALGAVCVNIREIPIGQAHGEKNARLQQVEIDPELRERVRAELRDRGVIP
jgi:hypothetical protein